MNSSVFNKSKFEVEEGVPETINDYFLSNYLNTMMNKHCKSVSSMIEVDRDNQDREQMIQLNKLMRVLKRVTDTSVIVEDLKYLEEENKSLSSLSDVSEGFVCVMNPLRNEFEKSLNQLPLRGFQMLSSSEHLAMIKILKDCDELLKKYYKHFSEELTEKSILVQHLQKILTPDLLQVKEKCNALMEAISNMSIRKLGEISACTADVLLKEEKN